MIFALLKTVQKDVTFQCGQGHFVNIFKAKIINSFVEAKLNQRPLFNFTFILMVSYSNLVCSFHCTIYLILFKLHECKSSTFRTALTFKHFSFFRNLPNSELDKNALRSVFDCSLVHTHTKKNHIQTVYNNLLTYVPKP